jgi:Uma2 family endonuclease
MSVAALLSIDEYLNTSYEPDCDYVDGVLEERNLGKVDHSRLQALLTIYLGSRERIWGICTVTEQRVRVSGKRVRIPDVCVLLDGHPKEQVIDVPPFMCIEILSPDDSVSGMMERLDDYMSFGVPNVWLIDPRRERSYFVTAAGLIEAHDNTLRSTNPEIILPVSELFESLR